jgi:hypothetical protein
MHGFLNSLNTKSHKGYTKGIKKFAFVRISFVAFVTFVFKKVLSA